MNDQNNRYAAVTQSLRVSRDAMTPAWQAVHDDLKARGFGYAADYMGDIMRLTLPSQYWKQFAPGKTLRQLA